MRTLFYSFFALCLITLFGACQQEVDMVLPDQLQNDSTYFSRAIALDTTKPSGTDTVFVLQFTYDQLKRLNRIVQRDLEGGIIRPDAIHTFQYNGNDTLPMRIDFINGPANSSTFYTYSGYFVVKDSTTGYDGANNYTRITQFSQVRPGWYLMKSILANDINPGVFETEDSIIFSRTYTAGNFVGREDSVWNAGLFNYVESGQVQYDRNKGPFWRFPLYYFGYFESAVPTLSFPTLNNVIAETIVNSNNGTIQQGASYEYNAAGYPSIARIRGIVDFNKYVFEYTHL